VTHHRVGDVLDQRALLLESASLDGVNLDFRHIVLHRLRAALSMLSRRRGPGRVS
jgi:hypothetical protein